MEPIFQAQHTNLAVIQTETKAADSVDERQTHFEHSIFSHV